MNADRLFALYNRVAEAPDAVSRLRRFVLDLAVRGKLVEQDPADEPASELLKRIAAERARLVRIGDIRKPKPSTPIDRAEVPFEAPIHWTWIRLRDIGTLAGGMTPSKNRPEYWDGDVIWLSPKDIKADAVSDSELKITKKGLSDTRLKLFPVGSLFMVARSGILKRTFPVTINRVPAASNQDLKVLVPFFKGQERYLQIVFRGLTTFVLKDLVKTGTTVQSLKYAEFEVQPIPLPPLAEQHRIVAKVDELMALCDRMAETRAEREDARNRLTKASLTPLIAPDTDAPTFRSHARFAVDALPALTARADQVKHLRQTIFNLAVRGRLVEQDPADEPASELLKRISDERKTLLRANRIKRVKVGPVELGEPPFHVPSTWQWTRLGNVGDWGAGSTPTRANTDFFGGGVTWLKSGELNDNRHLVGSEETITQLALDNCSFRMNRPGDVLIAMYGATIGKLAVLAESAVTNQAVCGCTPFQGVRSDFLFLFLLSQRSTFRRSSEGGAQPNISKVKIVAAPFPLPPLPEQHRIVAKVDEIMTLCDHMEAGLAAADGTRSRLLESLLHDALASAAIHGRDRLEA